MSNSGCCLVQFVCILIGSSLMWGGYENLTIANNNQQVHPTTLTELATRPPEKASWVKINGLPIAGSYIKKGDNEYVLFLDSESKLATFVKLAKNSSLTNQVQDSVTLLGMAKPFAEATTLVKNNIPQDVRVANLVIAENETPPDWWTTWGLMIVGFAIFGGAFGDEARKGVAT